jgi:hypothetical protein
MQNALYKANYPETNNCGVKTFYYTLKAESTKKYKTGVL